MKYCCNEFEKLVEENCISHETDDKYPATIDKDNWYLQFYLGDANNGEYDRYKIKYCPSCGAKLE